MKPVINCVFFSILLLFIVLLLLRLLEYLYKHTFLICGKTNVNKATLNLQAFNK